MLFIAKHNQITVAFASKLKYYNILFIRLVCYCDFYLNNMDRTRQKETDKEKYGFVLDLSRCVNLKNFCWYPKRKKPVLI